DRIDTLITMPRGNGLGLALHPDFPVVPQVFAVFDTSVYYGGGSWCEVIRFDYDALADTLGNDTVILSYQHYGEHAGGRLLFDTTGALLLTTADYWPENDTLGHRMGKVLRILADGSVPPDNPTSDHTWSRGHRNPQGMAMLPNGSVVISEHGQAGNNEINLVQADLNYGWPVFDGHDCTFLYPDSCTSSTFISHPPLTAYPEPPSGTEFYTSASIPEFTNKLITCILWYTGIKVFTMNASLDSVVAEVHHAGGAWADLVRNRDLAIHPDGSIFMITNDRFDPRIRRLYRDLPTGTQGPQHASVRLWPNPASEQVQLIAHAPIERIRVTDLRGSSQEIMIQFAGTRAQLDVGTLVPGTYVVQTFTSHSVGTGRLIVQ
ncbi:MAG: PQQ-dependent sugar dehydrogenase, partial [Flavobacteriales bacterium]|nr:PQQ-dependent sugar dehydrogenase [Flavobacteriales bacterium]